MISAAKARERASVADQIATALNDANAAILNRSADGRVQQEMKGQPWDSEGSETLNVVLERLSKLGYTFEFTGTSTIIKW